MRRHALLFLLTIVTVALSGCGKAATAPTPAPGAGIDPAAEAAVNATVQQAIAQSGIAGAPSTPPVPALNSTTFACPGGGNITTTFAFPPAPVLTPDGTVSSFILTGRTEFNDCRSQSVTMRGDPAIIYSTEFKSGGRTSVAAPSTMTTTITGAIRVDSNGAESRVRYDCVSTWVVQLETPASPTVTSSGTITWEAPVGTVVRTIPCGLTQ